MMNIRYVLPLAIFIFCPIRTSFSISVKPRITNAEQATVAPFVVSLQQVTPSGNVHYCGGTILNKNWAVTAAHCLSVKSVVSNSVLIAGSLLVSGESDKVQRRKIDRYVVHDLYVGGTSPYDIGLVFTKNAFEWTSAVRAATLPKVNSIPSGSASIFGWGSISTSTVVKYPKTLQTATKIPILTQIQCEKSLGSLAINLHETNVCTGPSKRQVSICTSDSGGPLMQGNTLIGIISWGKMPCGQKDFPSVYVRVSAFNTWIAKNQK